jgi:DNA-binding NtrC family response regulator
MRVSILFVDDEEQILRALARTLRDEGYDLTFCTCPLDALARLEARSFDIVVSDFMMPNLSGVDLLARTRAVRPSAVRVLMTGQADRSATIRAINEGAVFHYLEKPWEDADLKSALCDASRVAAAQRVATIAAPDFAGAARSFRRSSLRGTL